MKNLRTYLACVCMALSLGVSAQTTVPLNEPNMNKPKLFTNLPESITVDITHLTSLLNAEIGGTVTIPVSAAFRFQGHVVSSASKYGNSIQSIVIRSTNYNGAALTFSRITNADGTTSYTGRIVSQAHGDLYELKTANGQYSFVKKNFYDLINE